MKYYIWSHILFVIAIIGGYALGGYEVAIAIFVLAILEISLSFDNAIVNAKVLKNMTPAWQDRFIIYGIPIAVFGMRGVFPIAIVAIATGMGFTEVFNLAVNEPEMYHKALELNQDSIYMFGGSFLALVGLNFFLDNEKDVHWIPGEKYLVFINILKYPIVIITMTTVALNTGVTLSLPSLGATYGGILLFALIDNLDNYLSTDGVRYGVVGFLYLEVLDASFSFDGVIGAFAISNNIFIIMAGLGIGAMYIRSMTLDFVKHNVLDEYKYLEHSAMYAIIALSAIMITKIFVEVPEMLTAFIGVSFITIGFIHSYIIKKQG